MLVTSPLLQAGECDPVPFQDILAPGAGDLGFGKNVAVSEDGIAVVSNSECRVFALDGLTWELLGQPFPVPPSIYPNLRGAIHGRWFVAGEPSKNVNGSYDAGAVHVWELQGKHWVKNTQIDAAPPQAYASFGIDVSVLGDRILIGAYNAHSPAGYSTGAAYVFDYVGGVWQQTALFYPPIGTPLKDFAIGVHLDGDRAIMGCREVGTNLWKRHSSTAKSAGAGPLKAS